MAMLLASFCHGRLDILDSSLSLKKLKILNNSPIFALVTMYSKFEILFLNHKWLFLEPYWYFSLKRHQNTFSMMPWSPLNHYDRVTIFWTFAVWNLWDQRYIFCLGHFGLSGDFSKILKYFFKSLWNSFFGKILFTI